MKRNEKESSEKMRSFRKTSYGTFESHGQSEEEKTSSLLQTVKNVGDKITSTIKKKATPKYNTVS